MIKRNKVVKFALKMRDDYECRDLESLREHFDLEKTIAYFQDGRLITWMKHRGFYDIADELEEMSAEAADFPQKLCSLLEVEYTGEAVDAEDIAFYNERLKEIKQYTYDEKILSNAGCVAINQEELGELLEEDVKVIYLLDGEYSIPIKRKNHKYIGIGNVTAKIRSKEPVDFAKLEIEFENISFDSEYESICNSKSSNKAEYKEKEAAPTVQKQTFSRVEVSCEDEDVCDDEQEESIYVDTQKQKMECLRKPAVVMELFEKVYDLAGGFFDANREKIYMSDDIPGNVKRWLPTCTCVLSTSTERKLGYGSMIGFGANSMYFHEYNKKVQYEDVKKISYGYKIIVTYKIPGGTGIVSFGKGMSHQYEMALFLDIISGNNLLHGGRKEDLLNIRLKSCNDKTVRDIIG